MLKVKTHEKQFLNVTGETYDGVKKKLNIISKEIYTTCINTWIKKTKTRYMYYLIFILMNACP